MLCCRCWFIRRGVTALAAAAKLTDAHMLDTISFAYCDNPALTDAPIGDLLSACPSLATLNLSGCSQLSGDCVRAAAKIHNSIADVCLVRCT